jgi:hypothetical protein
MTIDISEAKVARNEFGLWLGWTLATAAGMLAGFLIAWLLVDETDLGLARVLVPLVAGFSVGFLQWLVLRNYLTYSVDWILTGGAGWAIGYAVGLILLQFLAGSLLSVLIGYLLFGLSIAIFQWPVLRREIPNAIPWVLANIIGWALGAYLSQFFLNLVYTGSAINPLLSTGVLSGLTGLIAGAITGLAFVWIVRQPERTYEIPASKPR